MKDNKIIFISSILIILNINVYSQKDTTICFKINSTEDQIGKKNVLGFGVLYFVNYYNPVPLLGINYERIMSKNNTFSFNVGSNIYHTHYNQIFSYGKAEYRFYFPDTGIPKTSSFQDDFYLQNKKSALLLPEGLFLGLAVIYKNSFTERTINDNEVTKEYANGISIGGNLGYQFRLFNKIQTNISIPLAIGIQRVRKVEQGESIKKTYGDISFFLIDINFGIAF